MHACTRVRLLLVLVCGIMYHIRTYLISARLPRYVHPTLRTSVTLVVCIRTRDLPTCPSKASVYEAKRIATSTTTTHTRDNKPFEAAAVQQRRCAQLSYSLAVSSAVLLTRLNKKQSSLLLRCCCCCNYLKIMNDIIHRKTGLCFHRPHTCLLYTSPSPRD